MTYREILKLYKQGKLEESKKKQVEADIEKQDAISEYLYEEGPVPELEDLGDGAEADMDNMSEREEKPQKTHTENEKKSQEDFNSRFIKEINRSIRRAFIKMGMAVGAAILVIVLCAVFILPKAVSKLYYDPNEVVGKYEDLTTTRMSLDMAVYSELFLPGNYREQVNAVSRGYGEYDILIPQSSTITGKFTSVSGRLVRGKLTLYDNNVLSRPSFQFYLPGDEQAWEAWEVDENGDEKKTDTEARKQESIKYSKEEIEKYNDNDWYTAYVSINKIMDYKDFIQWFNELSEKKNLEWGSLWCAVHTEEEGGYCVEPNIGFSPYPSGLSMSWDREKYPYLSLLDNEEIWKDTAEYDEKTMQTHFISMLSYVRDNDEILSLMNQDSDFPEKYQKMIDYVEKKGLKIHGFAISAKKDTLLELYKEDVVCYIQTTPQS